MVPMLQETVGHMVPVTAPPVGIGVNERELAIAMVRTAYPRRHVPERGA